LSASALSSWPDAGRLAAGDTPFMATIPEARTPVSIRDLTVRDQMSTGIISCAPATPLRKVAQLMAEHRVHAIFVFDYGREDDETTELWGLVSDLDVVAASRGRIDERTAGDSAVTPLVTVTSDASLDQAARLMAETESSHLAVLDWGTHRPVGVLSSLDVARAVAAEPPIPV
jgi:CBS domain-containing protein